MVLLQASVHCAGSFYPGHIDAFITILYTTLKEKTKNAAGETQSPIVERAFEVCLLRFEFSQSKKLLILASWTIVHCRRTALAFYEDVYSCVQEHAALLGIPQCFMTNVQHCDREAV